MLARLLISTQGKKRLREKNQNPLEQSRQGAISGTYAREQHLDVVVILRGGRRESV